MNVLVINGHPDAGNEHFGEALIKVYAAGAQAAGHELQVLKIAELEFPLVRSTVIGMIKGGKHAKQLQATEQLGRKAI